MTKKKKHASASNLKKYITALSIIVGLFFTAIMTYYLQKGGIGEIDIEAMWKRKQEKIKITSNIYDDNLNPNWKEWSSADVDIQERYPVYSGNKSISFISQNNSVKFYLHTRQVIDTSFYDTLHLAVRATQPNQSYGIQLLDENENPLSNYVEFSTISPLKQNEWVTYDIPLSVLKAGSAKISGIVIKGQREFIRKKIFIDDIRLNSIAIPLPSITALPSILPSNLPSNIPTGINITQIPTRVPSLISPNPTISQPAPTSTTSAKWWQPTPDKPIHWHWQLSEDFVYPRDIVDGARVYDIDGEYATADTVAKLHALGQDVKVICYFDAGVFENYRSDAAKFPQSIIGNKDVGWEGSYWLDIRQTDILLPIMRDRMVTWCKNKGFDAIEPDETEVWSNNSGFNITKEQNNFYNRKIAEMAHELGLSVGLKGNTTEATDLWPYFDWTLNEECWQYDECSILKSSFIDHGKAVFNVEYQSEPNCKIANQWHMNSAKRDLNLVGPTSNSYRYSPCVPNAQSTW